MLAEKLGIEEARAEELIGALDALMGITQSNPIAPDVFALCETPAEAFFIGSLYGCNVTAIMYENMNPLTRLFGDPC